MSVRVAPQKFQPVRLRLRSASSHLLILPENLPKCVRACAPLRNARFSGKFTAPPRLFQLEPRRFRGETFRETDGFGAVELEIIGSGMVLGIVQFEPLLDDIVVPTAGGLQVRWVPHEGRIALVGDDVVDAIGERRSANCETASAQRVLASEASGEVVPCLSVVLLIAAATVWAAARVGVFVDWWTVRHGWQGRLSPQRSIVTDVPEIG